MKKIYYFAIAIVAAFAFTSCDNFLDSTNTTQANTSNFPAQTSDLEKELSSLYYQMNALQSDPLQTPFFVANIMSDDLNGAGGTGDVESHAIGHLMSNKTTLFDNMWSQIYIAIAEANSIINSVEVSNNADMNQLLGEAYFMRGLFYLWGTQAWGDIPAYYTASCPTTCPQASAEEVIYPHIFADFVTASNLMTKKTQGDGHATKYAAEAYLARAYMFYEGFYKNVKELAVVTPEDITLPKQATLPEQATLSKEDVKHALEDVIEHGGYDLVKDYRLLWQYTNKYSAPDYTYVSDLANAGRFWAGNGNEEQIFQIQFGNMASWNGDNTMGLTNMTSLYSALRCDGDAAGSSDINGQSNTFPFAQGWGQGTINDNLWNDWSDKDPRKRATILNCEAELSHFVYTTSCSEETGYYNKKLIPVTTKSTADEDMTAGPYTWWGIVREEFNAGQNNGNCMQGDHFADIILMRLADVYLMHAELTGDMTYFQEVRERAYNSQSAADKAVNPCPAKPAYSLQVIQDERRFELAGEGLRFNDLRRWSGKNGGSNCLAAKMLERQNGSKVNYCGNWTKIKHASTGWAARYAETDGFLAIPETEIAKVNDETVLKQNPGWYSASKENDYNMSGTPIY